MAAAALRQDREFRVFRLSHETPPTVTRGTCRVPGTPGTRVPVLWQRRTLCPFAIPHRKVPPLTYLPNFIFNITSQGP
eukprot:2273288-Rhodomonas_salina.4